MTHTQQVILSGQILNHPGKHQGRAERFGIEFYLTDSESPNREDSFTILCRVKAGQKAKNIAWHCEEGTRVQLTGVLRAGGQYSGEIYLSVSDAILIRKIEKI